MLSFKSSSLLLFITFFILILGSIPKKSVAQNIDLVERITFWSGYSPFSIRLLGKTHNATSQIIAIGYERRLLEYKPDYYLWFTVDLIPYLQYDYAKRDDFGQKAKRSGIGLSPIGFKVVHTVSNTWNPYLSTSGSIIYMNDEFPTDKSRKLNFTFDINFGNTFQIGTNTFLSLGYKFHHISNAQTGEENPGLDSNFLFLKISIQ